MREEVIAAGQTLQLSGRIYGLRFIDAAPGSTWTPDNQAIARPVAARRECKPDRSKGYWSQLLLTAGTLGALQVELLEDPEETFGHLGAPLSSGPRRLAFGAVVNVANGLAVALANLDCSLCRIIEFAAGPIALDAGTATPTIFPIDPSGNLAIGMAFTSPAIGGGASSILQVGEGVGGAPTATATNYKGVPQRIRQAAFYFNVAGGVTHINNIPWEIWGYP